MNLCCSRGDRGWLTHFFVKNFKLLLHEIYSRYFDSDSKYFFIKLLTEKESQNIQVLLLVPEIFSKMLNKATGLVDTPMGLADTTLGMVDTSPF